MAPPAIVLSAPLWLVRHGETPWNVEGRLQGQRDIAMNGRGRDQAAEVGRRLGRAIADPGRLPWVASPLGRTRETVELARRAIGLDAAGYALDDTLKELTFGDWEGLTWPEVQARDAAAAAARDADKWNYRPPGGESYADLAQRVAGWLRTLDRETVAVSHGGVARAVIHLLAGVPPETAPNIDIFQGRAMRFANGGYEWV